MRNMIDVGDETNSDANVATTMTGEKEMIGEGAVKTGETGVC